MPLRYKTRIIEHLAHDQYKPATRGAVARDMRIEDDDLAEFNEAINMLIADKQLLIGKDELLRLPSLSHEEEITGSFRLNRRRFGFLIPDRKFREGDLFIPPGSVGGALSRDKVRARVIQGSSKRGRNERDRISGEIIEVIERGNDKFVGTLVRKGGQWLVEPDGRMLYDPVVIRDPHAKNAKQGDKVVIELLHFPEPNYLAEGVITEVLGEAGRPDVETQAVITAHGLRTEFPEAALDQARDASRQYDEETADDPAAGREDLRETFIFTIDPPDAKDFDDAISITFDEKDKRWTLGVHIADVAHFVKIGSALDIEAQERGNSVYLPRLVIPMLPEVLSNGICSLQEGVPRFAKSAFIMFDGKGVVQDQRVSATLIQSARRLTYLEAQHLIDGDQKEARKHARTEPNYTDELVDALRRANTLATILRKRRRRDGMIVLNLPSVDLVFGDDGHVIDALPEDDAFTHTIIEMFMVEANEAVARLFDSLNVPLLRRIHPEPTYGDMEELRIFAAAARVPVPDEPTRHDLQKILEATRDTPASRAVHFAVLRTLTKASYSPAVIGHYALASDHYAHFTSPIRRYPDLTVHRALAAFLDVTENGRRVPGGRKRHNFGRRLMDDRRVLDEAQLITLGNHCSETEDEAEKAEESLRDFLVLQFLKENHLGDEMEGVITGMTGSGLFISIQRYLVDGMVRMQDLPTSSGRPDRWEKVDAAGRLVARRSGASIGIGDVLTVKIIAVDPATRQLDLEITKMPEPRDDVPAAPNVGSKRGKGRGKNQQKTKGKGKGGKRKRK